MVHHGIAKNVGHFADDQKRNVSIVAAVEHSEQRLVRVESQLFQNAHTKSADNIDIRSPNAQ